MLEVDQIDCTIASEAAATQFWSVLAVLVSPRPYFQLPLSTHLEMCIAPALARLLPGGVLRCQRNFAKVVTIFGEGTMLITNGYSLISKVP